MTAIRDQIDSLIDEAGRRDLPIRKALTLSCGREIARKKPAIVSHWSEDNGERRIEMGFCLARFPFSRDRASFDFAAQPSVDRGQIRELATGRFIANGEAVLLLRAPGVGKTHLAVTIGREATVVGYTVLFVPDTTLVAALAKAHAEGRRGIDIGALPPTDRNVEGIVEVMLDATRNFLAPLTVERLFGWHAALFPPPSQGHDEDHRRRLAR